MKVKMLVAFFIIVVCLVTLGRIDAQGEVTAYDADNQFLGILMGSTGGAANIFVPSSETVISITYNDGDSLKGLSGLRVSTVQVLHIWMFNRPMTLRKLEKIIMLGKRLLPLI